MSRVGNRLIKIANGVELEINKNVLTVKGPKGTLTKEFSSKIEIKIEEGILRTIRKNEVKQTIMLHGTTNSLINSMIIGVTEGFKKELEIIGVGYNVILKGNTLVFSLGLSHKIELEIPAEIQVEIKKPTEIMIIGIDKQFVGQFAAKIKSFRKPEPYGGKGIRYKGETIIRKAGKAASK